MKRQRLKMKQPYYLSHTKEMEFCAFYLTNSGHRIFVTYAPSLLYAT